MNTVKLVALICFIAAILLLFLYMFHAITWEQATLGTLSDLTLYETVKVLVT